MYPPGISAYFVAMHQVEGRDVSMPKVPVQGPAPGIIPKNMSYGLVPPSFDWRKHTQYI